MVLGAMMTLKEIATYTLPMLVVDKKENKKKNLIGFLVMFVPFAGQQEKEPNVLAL